MSLSSLPSTQEEKDTEFDDDNDDAEVEEIIQADNDNDNDGDDEDDNMMTNNYPDRPHKLVHTFQFQYRYFSPQIFCS